MLRTPFFLAAALAAASAVAVAAEPEIVNLNTLRAQMRYSVTDINTAPGQAVKIIFENTDDMPHNLVFCQPGTDIVAMSNKQMEKPEEAVKRNFLPEDPAIWLHSKTLNPKEKEELAFNAPSAPGDYPYVCTMPGHALLMKGMLHVLATGKGLTDLKYKLYLGSWEKLPNFSQLTPAGGGDLPGNLIDLKPANRKEDYGMVFDGKIDAPKTADYLFALASDDGSRLLIDGKKVVEDDGVHPSESIHEARVHLTAGPHDYHLEYFQKGGEAELYAGWKGANFSITPLSTWLHPSWNGQVAKKKDNNTGMPLIVGTEPIIYRNFISGAGNRGIGVGYPGNVNIAWSAETMNLALVWRGAFIDAARHWTDRGGGFQPPLGYDVFAPVDGLTVPFAVSTGAEPSWPKIKPGARAEGYEWKGYRLDDKRQPTFSYEWNGLKVTDHFDVEGDAVASQGKLIRTLKLEGTIPAGTLFRVAGVPRGASIEPAGAGFLVKGSKLHLDGNDSEDQFLVEAAGAKIHLEYDPAKPIAEQKNPPADLVLPAEAKIQVVYTWPSNQFQQVHAQ